MRNTPLDCRLDELRIPFERFGPMTVLPRTGFLFVSCVGLELLIGLLCSSSLKQQLDGAVALCKLANKAMTLSHRCRSSFSNTPGELVPNLLFASKGEID
ncbi:hypothetical protein RIF29_29182 [Crotalaria pallida]|uniref:Uncharacterized protein n=1 Tax=Crotalaria pallida TaxID=3830 RepID=A0AAN9EEI1_CROPI